MSIDDYQTGLAGPLREIGEKLVAANLEEA